MKPNWVYGLLVCFLICLFRNGTRGITAIWSYYVLSPQRKLVY